MTLAREGLRYAATAPGSPFRRDRWVVPRATSPRLAQLINLNLLIKGSATRCRARGATAQQDVGPTGRSQLTPIAVEAQAIALRVHMRIATCSRSLQRSVFTPTTSNQRHNDPSQMSAGTWIQGTSSAARPGARTSAKL